jgi:hypothetical protein
MGGEIKEAAALNDKGGTATLAAFLAGSYVVSDQLH